MWLLPLDTLGWDKGGPCHGEGQPLPRLLAGGSHATCVQCVLPSPLRFSCPIKAPQRGSGRLRAPHQTSGGRLALHCFPLWPLMLGSLAGLLADTHSGLVTYGKKCDQVVAPACLPGSNPKQIPSNTQQQQTTVANAPGQTLSSFLMSH